MPTAVLLQSQADQITFSNEIDYRMAKSIFDFTVFDTYNKPIQLGEFCRGYVTVIVNIASGCNLAGVNYAQLTQFQKEMGDSKKYFVSFLFIKKFKKILCFFGQNFEFWHSHATSLQV